MKLEQFLNEDKQIDEIGRFLVVTKPTGESTLADILFYTDVFSFCKQIQGGLKEKEIVGIYKNYKKAKKIAEKLLETQ